MKILRTAALGSNFTGSYKKKSVSLSPLKCQMSWLFPDCTKCL